MATILVTPYNPETNAVPALPLRAQDLTLSDANDYNKPITVVFKTAGDLKVLPFLGAFDGTATAITITGTAGQVIPFRCKRVYSTDSTATAIGVF